MSYEKTLANKCQKLSILMKNLDRHNLAARFAKKKLLENDLTRYLVLALLNSLHSYYYLQNKTDILPSFDEWFVDFEKQEAVALWNWMSEQGADTHIGIDTESYKIHMQPNLMGRLYRTWFSLLTQHHANLLFWQEYSQNHGGFLVSHPLLDYKGIDALMLAPEGKSGQWSANEIQIKKDSFKFKKAPKPNQVLIIYETLPKALCENRFKKKNDKDGNLVPMKAYQDILDNKFIDIHENSVITFNETGAKHYAEICQKNTSRYIDTPANLMAHYSEICDQKEGDPNMESLWHALLFADKRILKNYPEWRVS